MLKYLLRPLLICALLTLVSLIARGNSTDDAKIVAALDTEYQAAVKNNDADTMDRILSDDMVVVLGSGKIYTKADLLQMARTRRVQYQHQEDSEQSVRVWRDTAVVTAQIWLKGTDEGKPFTSITDRDTTITINPDRAGITLSGAAAATESVRGSAERGLDECATSF